MKTHYLLTILGWLMSILSTLAQSNAPANLKATAAAYNKVVLTWEDKSTNETRFEIERNSVSGFVKIDQVNTNIETYTDNTVSGGVTYTYRIKAVFVTNANYSNEQPVTTPQEPPATPTGLGATLQNGGVLVKWDNGIGGLAANYRVERSVQGGAYSLYQTVQYSRTPNLTDNGVQSGQQYCYRVQAINGGGSSGYAGPACQSIPLSPTIVKNLKATAQNSTSIKLTWDPYGKENSISIERRSGKTGNWNKLANATSNDGTYTDNNLTASTEYCYRIAEDGHEYSDIACETTSAPPVVTPVTPAQPTVLSISTSQLQVFWTDANVVPVTFEISRSDKPGGAYTVIQADYAQKIFDDKNLTASMQYCYRVRARNGSTYSNYSTETCGTTKTPTPTVPNAPGRLAFTAITSNQIDLQWADLSDNETGFQIERADGPTEVFSTIQNLGINADSYSDKTVQANKQYCYRVRAVNAVGSSDPTESKCATTPAPPPGVPANLTATVKSPTQIDLTFSTSNASAGDFYEVQRSTAGGAFQVLKNVQIDASGNGLLNDTALQPNTRYCYKVRRYSAPQTDFSGEICASTPDVPPADPTSLTITSVAYNQISLQWTDNSTNESGFVLERSTDGTSFNTLANLLTNLFQYSDQTVTPQLHYYYRVRAINAAGQSGNSNTVDAITPVGPPAAAQDLKAAATSTTQIGLTWSLIANATSVVVERSPDGTSGWSSVTSVAGSVTSYSDNNLTPNTRYYYRIRATNSSGTGLNSSIADAITPDVPPTAPTQLTATVVSATQINLQWADRSTNESGFEIERGTSTTGAFTKIADVKANVTTYEDKTPTDNTQYCYRIQAKNAAGLSAYTEPVCATTPLAPPATPTNLVAQIVDYDQVRLTWPALGASAVTVVIERSTAPASGFTEIKQQAASQTNYVDMGLKEFTTYYYRIKAVNAAGASNFSNIATARVEEIIIAVEDELETHTTLLVNQRTLHIVTNWFTTAKAVIHLQTGSGQVVLTDSRTVRPTERWDYNLNALPTGLYIISIVADGRKLAKRILLP